MRVLLLAVTYFGIACGSCKHVIVIVHSPSVTDYPFRSATRQI